SRFPFSVSGTTEIPMSDALLLLSRGSLQQGNAQISVGSGPVDVATISTTIHYSSTEVFDHLGLCSLKRGRDSGFGIFTPHLSPDRSQVFIDMELILPAKDHRYALSSLETDLPNFSQRSFGISNVVDVNTISFKGSNGYINAEVSAENINLKTSNGLVSGIFNATRELTIVTSNDPVHIDVGLTSKGSEPTHMLLKTSNAYLKAAISCLSVASSEALYDMTAKTSNGHLSLDLPTMPVGAVMMLDAATTNQAADVHLNPAFEGSYSLRTSNAHPEVLEDEDVADPTGEGRTRQLVDRGLSKGICLGQISWDGEEHPSTVSVKTSNARVTLRV
ncbi:hypothetical protein FISHEDRAFT_33836, partial [Fistulina hepatica ATCC 64428]